MIRRPLLAGAVAALALLATGCSLSGEDAEPAPREPATTEATPTPTPLASAEDAVQAGANGEGFDPRAIYDREAAGVVTVLSVFGGGAGGGEGSGFVLSERGEIATNAHVIAQGEGSRLQRASQVFVEFEDGNQVEARIVGEDPNADIALLRVEPDGLDLRPLPLGSSAAVEVGEPVAAIGSPFGEERSLSVGVVSAIDRSVESLTQFRIDGAIQTDAAINPGNSGGPLVNRRGQVIGVNQQIRSQSGGGEGVGFAVPVDLVKFSLAQLRETGRVRYAYVGISSVPLYPQLAERFDLPVREGAWLQEVTPGGPADDADLRGGEGPATRFQASGFVEGGDVITRLEGQPIRDATDLSQAAARFRPGQRVTLEVWRDGDRRRVELTLGERPLSSSPE